MLKFGPFSGHFDYLARILVLARNFGSTGSSAYSVVETHSIMGAPRQDVFSSFM